MGALVSGLRGPLRSPLRGPFDPGFTAKIKTALNPIAALFSNGEQGAWYDPSDLTTMFQNAAGTTPVTAVEQPVGLLLDKSKGLVLGSELVTNGGFDSAGSWTTLISSTISGGSLNISGLSGGLAAARQVISVTAGKAYQITFTVSAFSAGDGVSVWVGGTTGAFRSTNGTYSEIVSAGTTNTEFRVVHRGVAALTCSIDNISVRELPGNHATQTTATKRPVLSARVNHLIGTENFTPGGNWATNNMTSSLNVATSPDGTQTADQIVETAVSGAHDWYNIHQPPSVIGTSYTQTCHLKAGTRSWAVLRISVSLSGGNKCAYFDLANGVVGTVDAGITATISAADNGWYRCGISYTATAVNAWPLSVGAALSNETFNYLGDGVSGLYVWGAQVETRSTETRYQRVDTATSYDTVGFKHYLKFDGIDDALVTGSIDFTATDKMTVVAGVRKLSDAARGVAFELGTSTFSANGGFAFMIPQVNGETNYGIYVRATIEAERTLSNFAAPHTAVLSCALNFANPASTKMLPRVNGSIPTITGASDPGTGNFANTALYIGSRAGTSLPFNGHLYSLIVRGAQSTDAQIVAAETWVNGKTGAY